MKFFEAVVLLFVGLISGVLVALFDIYTAAGSVMFFTRISVWILLNVFLAVHITDWKRAAWWAIPFNLGLVEMYYACLTISYEGLARSTMLPLAGMAVIAPLLTIVAWTAKNEKGIFGKLLSAVIVAGELLASAIISNGPAPLDVVVAVLLVLILFVMRPKKLVVVPSTAEEVLGPDGTIDEGFKTTGGHKRLGLSADPLKAARAERQARRKSAAGDQGAQAGRGGSKPKQKEDRQDSQKPTKREPSRIAHPSKREDAQRQRPTRRTGGKTSANTTIRTRGRQAASNGAAPLGTSQRPRPSRTASEGRFSGSRNAGERTSGRRGAGGRSGSQGR